MANTTPTVAELQAKIAELTAQVESKGQKKNLKAEPAQITASGCVNFPGVAGFSGLSLNPEAFESVHARMEAAWNLYKSNEALVKATYQKHISSPEYMARRSAKK